VLRRRAAQELGLPVSVGVGRTKLMAKLASRAAKPDGLLVVGEDDERRLRATLPVEDVWGIGARTLERLRHLGVRHLGELAAVSDGDLRSTCGTAVFRRLRAIQAGNDDAVVRSLEDRTSVSSETSTKGFQRADRTPDELVAVCVQRLCHRLRTAGQRARVLTLALQPEQPGPALVRRRAVLDATADPEFWLAVARELLHESAPPPLSGARATATDLTGAREAQATLF
jgi:DNA polymerase IV